MKEQDNFTNNFVNQNNIASLSLSTKNNDNQLSNNNFQINNFNQNQQNFISNLNINNIVSLNQSENINKNTLPISYINNYNDNSNIKNTNEFQFFENINQNLKKDNNQIQSEIINFNQKSIFNNFNNNFFNNNNIINNFFMGGNNINKGTKPYFTKKHSLLNAHSINEINEYINKDILQLEKFLPNFKQYVANNYSESINICLKYIEFTNFFFNEEATKKVNDILQTIIVSDNYNNYGNMNNQYNEINQIQEKIKELYKKLIPFDIRVSYLDNFYDKNPEKNLANLFRNDLNKYQKSYEKKYYLHEIFEIVKQKMNNKDKEEIKNIFNRILFNSKSQSNYNNNNNASLGSNGSNNNNGGNYQNNYNHHHNNSTHQYRKYSYQSPGDQTKTSNSNSSYNTHDNNYNNGNGSHYRHMNYNNNRNNNYLNDDDNLGYKNNYDHHHNSSYQRNNNNYKSSYSSRHFYNNMNSKNANNRNKGNRKNSAYSGVLVEIDSSPKKLENENSDGNANKEEDKKIVNDDNNITNQNPNIESEEEIKNGNENHESNLKNEEFNDNNINNIINNDQLDLENNLNINKENSKKENIHIIDVDDNKSEDNLNLKDENILNDFNLINPFQENTTSEENSERGDSIKNNILNNPHNDSDIIKMNINDNLNEKENKYNEENNNDNNIKASEQEKENDLILNIISSNENNLIGSTLYENNLNNFNNITENNQYQYNINEEEDKKVVDKKDENESDKNKNEIKSSDIPTKVDSVPRYNSDNNIKNKNNTKLIYNYNQNNNNFIGNNMANKNISNNQNSNNLYNNNLQNNLNKEQQQLLKIMMLQNNLLMNMHPYTNQHIQNINFNNNINNPQMSNLLNNLNANNNPFNSFYNQYYYQIFCNYWSDESNLLSNLRNNLLNSHSTNYHSNINYINNKCEKLLKDYNHLKDIQKEYPSSIKEFTTLFEEKIILPVYTKINEENQTKKKVYTEVYNKYKNIILTILAKHSLEETQIEPYGSIVNNFMTEWGDIDICIIPKDNNLIQNFWEYLEEIKNEAVDVQKIASFNLLERYPRFLILKMKDIEKNIELDITVQNKLPILNTRLIRFYSLLDQRFHIFGIFLKFWVKKNHIHGALDKFLTSYALLILIIHYLQNIAEPKILPILQQVENKKTEYKYHFEEKELITNIYFEEDLDKINNYMNIINDKKENNSTVVDLLIGFFEFYAYKYDHYLISISRSDKKPVGEDEKAAFPIEDPFDINYNPGKSMRLDTINYSAFIYCMKKELNNILSGVYFKFGTGE